MLKFTRIDSHVGYSLYARKNGYHFEIQPYKNKYFVVVQNYNNINQNEIDVRVPTYNTAWSNITFNSIEEAEQWCNQY